MTDFRRAEQVWDEDGVNDDDAKTLVARNPLRPADGERAGDASDFVRDSEIELLRESAEGLSSEEAERVSTDVVNALAKLASEDARESVEALRDSEVDRLRAEEAAESTRVEPLVLQRKVSDALPSVVLSGSFSTRHEITERLPTLPSTHPLASSIAPTAAPKTVPPASESRTPVWRLALAAAAVVGLGVGLAHWQTAVEEREPPVAAASARQAEHIPEVVPHPAPIEPEPAPAEVVEAAPPPPADLPIAEAAPPAPPQPAPSLAVPAGKPAAAAPAAKTGAGAPRKAKTAAVPTTTAGEERQAKVPAATAPKPVGASDLPLQPSREQVVEIMEGMLGKLNVCAGGRRGVVEANITVRASGQVSYALVNGSFAGTPEGSCMAQALRQARFPAFAQPVLRVTYPFQL